MKQKIAATLDQALQQLKSAGHVPAEIEPQIRVDHTRDKAHGDFATNLAMMLAKPCGMAPRQVAELLVDALPDTAWLVKVEIAGPGFINFFVETASQYDVIRAVLAEGERFGRSGAGGGEKVLVEFVSANPTGPLHVGHGRGAAYGASVSNLLEAAGYSVHREYYVNDAGRQMDILATSVWLRYLELLGEQVDFPSNGYQGDYIRDTARRLKDRFGEALHRPLDEVYKNVPPDAPEGDKEAHIDALIANAKALLQDQYAVVHQAALDDILTDIKEDLAEFRVHFDTWFSEKSLFDTGLVDETIARLQAAGKIYEKDGALWFRSTEYGDEKDRVVVRENGIKTYFASDIAYHLNKFERGFERLIDIWGADHHGYIPRVRAALKALDLNDAALEVLLVQFATLWRGGEKVPMSTRSGQFVTLRELREEVGVDAARFFYVMRKSEQHMDFDLDLAKSQSNDNPVYYIQYAHARIASVLRQAEEKGMPWDRKAGEASLNLLVDEREQALASELARYPELIVRAAHGREPHLLAYYLRDLAGQLHSYYNATPFLVEEAPLRNARLTLVVAVKQVIYNGLALLGVSAPEQM
ncbi:arginyl-tRNA synthetase [Sulfurivirga caldicuralii]|uniref:Arginine--tRNA ligase n=1 Tax=Sulfurivirga caldicuralii TaxID=364032 RepID=A0A1N6DRK0_9GAMM|nr:arginine--tRNA ligase [Sulfurivirga caldicuralii]SIN73370.1 arginyl-tRNA synthetase [Sulfurivirga caldicuralii]